MNRAAIAVALSAVLLGLSTPARASFECQNLGGSGDPNPQVINLYWSTNWQSTSPFSSGEIDQFTERLLNSDYFSRESQYGVGPTQNGFAGSYGPVAPCSGNPNSTTSDFDIDTWVECMLGNPASNIPISNNIVYVVYMPPGTGNDNRGGYNTTTTLTGVPIAVIFEKNNNQATFATPGDSTAITVTISHELSEIFSQWLGNGWFCDNNTFIQVADVCQKSSTPGYGTAPGPLGPGDGTAPEMAMMGALWPVAGYWSNQDQQCWVGNHPADWEEPREGATSNLWTPTLGRDENYTTSSSFTKIWGTESNTGPQWTASIDPLGTSVIYVSGTAYSTEAEQQVEYCISADGQSCLGATHRYFFNRAWSHETFFWTDEVLPTPGMQLTLLWRLTSETGAELIIDQNDTWNISNVLQAGGENHFVPASRDWCVNGAGCSPTALNGVTLHYGKTYLFTTFGTVWADANLTHVDFLSQTSDSLLEPVVEPGNLCLSTFYFQSAGVHQAFATSCAYKYFGPDNATASFNIQVAPTGGDVVWDPFDEWTQTVSELDDTDVEAAASAIPTGILGTTSTNYQSFSPALFVNLPTPSGPNSGPEQQYFFEVYGTYYSYPPGHAASFAIINGEGKQVGADHVFYDNYGNTHYGASWSEWISLPGGNYTIGWKGDGSNDVEMGNSVDSWQMTVHSTPQPIP